MNNKKALYENIIKDVSKVVKKHLNEAEYYNPEKDKQRIQSIIDKSKGDSLKMMSYAFRMALSIKDPVKLEARMDAALELLGEDHIIYQCFYAVNNDDLLYYDFSDDMDEDVKLQYQEALRQYAIKKHQKDKEYFEIIDGEYVRYSPDVVFTDDIMLSKRFPGSFITQTKVGQFIQNIAETYENYIDEDNFSEGVLNLLYDYVSGFNRATIDEVISSGYTKSDFEDEENFEMMPISLQKKFE